MVVIVKVAWPLALVIVDAELTVIEGGGVTSLLAIQLAVTAVSLSVVGQTNCTVLALLPSAVIVVAGEAVSVGSTLKRKRRAPAVLQNSPTGPTQGAKSMYWEVGVDPVTASPQVLTESVNGLPPSEIVLPFRVELGS
ncbi:MAG: hypothetical protein BGP24_15490 [Lysobacterales bacterium 69-70]|nr:MAG: hypothetical protein ABS97_04065 [Xanthomonadaceae bacterium SCN 69-320]ODV22981.1 MAG: hypothetical protein ABT27_00550 [Xanthomonadaceae bacterium SCN 69-25]OJY96706.1 MAG: hypothetical protein BGP24_15490 [Xanthomonadales bacterium 69-70]